MKKEEIRKRLVAIAHDLHAKRIYCERILWNEEAVTITRTPGHKRAAQLARLRREVAKHHIDYVRREQRITYNIAERAQS